MQGHRKWLFGIRVVLGSICLLSAPGVTFGQSAPAAGAQTPVPPQLNEIVIVCKQHFDIGYTQFAYEVLKYYRTGMIDKALGVVDATGSLPPEQQFVWTLPGWPLAQIIGPQQTPERRERVVRALRDRRLVVHALPASLHTESMDLEDVVRGLGWSSGICRSLGLELPRDAKMTDVPSHVWLMPTLLARAGVDFFHFAGNKACVRPDLPRLFWWEGPDGSRVLTMQSRGYGTDVLPPPDWPYATWVAVMHTGDNHGPPDAAKVAEIIEDVAARAPGVKVRMGRLSDFADALLKEKASIPVVRSDIPDQWIYGVMSQPRATAVARNVRPLIGTVEILATHLRAWGARSDDVTAAVAQAYEGSMLYGEHTWGMATATFGLKEVVFGDEFLRRRAAGRYKTIEASWQEHADYILKARDLTMSALDRQLAVLSGAVNVEGDRVVVFNPLPWPRSGVVTLKLSARRLPAAMKALDDAQTAPCSASGPDSVDFVAANVPAFGYRTFVPVGQIGPASSARDVKRLQTKYFEVVVDPERGCIRSLVDKRIGRGLVDSSGPHGFGQYVYERFDTDDRESWLDAYTLREYGHADRDFGKLGMTPASQTPHVTASPTGFEVRAMEGPVASTLIMKAPPTAAVPHSVQLMVTLYQEQPFVDLEWSIEDKPAEAWPEAGWLALPFAVESPSFRVGRLGSVIDPATQIVRGANRDILCLNTGLMIRDGRGGGVALCPLDSPLVSLERPGLWKYTQDFVPTRPVAYINLYNNIWSTNFAQWVEGSWSSRVRVWATDKAEDAAGLVRPSWEARLPLRAAFATGPAGSLQPTQTGLHVSGGSVLVTALGSNPDGSGTLLRLWEQGGRKVDCRVGLPVGMKVEQAQPCDLRGRPTDDPIPVKHGEFTVPVAAWAPASFILE